MALAPFARSRGVINFLLILLKVCNLQQPAAITGDDFNSAVSCNSPVKTGDIKDLLRPLQAWHWLC
jgi:hypothetical protein